MGLVKAKVVDNRENVPPRMRLRVIRFVLGNVGGRVPPRIKCNALVTAPEITKLRLPTSMIARKFMDKYERFTRARRLEIQPAAIVG